MDTKKTGGVGPVWIVQALSLLACAIPALLIASAHATTATEVFRTAAPSVVVVKAEGPNGSAQGSGVVFGQEPVLGAWIATNYHVVSRASRLTVSFAGYTYQATILGIDDDLDLCLLMVEDLPARAARTRNTPALSIGEQVYAIGAPQGLELSLSDGIVSQFRKHSSTYRLIQTTAPISRGSSGGGLFDREGRLIGITTFFLRDSQNLNFAVPVAAIEDVRHASVLIALMSNLAADPSKKFASALDQAVPGWRRDLEANSFRRWLGLARDANGKRRTGGVSGLSILALPPESWQSAAELFSDYRASPLYHAERAQEKPRAAPGH